MLVFRVGTPRGLVGRYQRSEKHAALMKLTASWYIAPCSLVEVDRRFRGASLINLRMEVISISETSVYLDETTQGNISKSCYLQTRDRENMKFHILFSSSGLKFHLHNLLLILIL
jgi:hypothetical protein